MFTEEKLEMLSMTLYSMYLKKKGEPNPEIEKPQAAHVISSGLI